MLRGRRRVGADSECDKVKLAIEEERRTGVKLKSTSHDDGGVYSDGPAFALPCIWVAALPPKTKGE
jgi:hypothetical protein